MGEALDTIEYAGYKIEICSDEDCSSPRDNDNLGRMVCFHRKYRLGDKHDLKMGNFNSWDELHGYLVGEMKAEVILSLRLYDHGGISISAGTNHPYNDPWDSMAVGFIYASKEAILKNWGKKKLSKKLLADTKRILLSEIQEYDGYLRGDAYGYRVSKDGKEYDSCWGFIGDKDYCVQAAKDAVDFYDN